MPLPLPRASSEVRSGLVLVTISRDGKVLGRYFGRPKSTREDIGMVSVFSGFAHQSLQRL